MFRETLVDTFSALVTMTNKIALIRSETWQLADTSWTGAMVSYSLFSLYHWLVLQPIGK